MNKLLIPIFAALLVAGCETATQQSSSEKPVKHAGRLKAALYDSSSRSATTQLDVYDSEQKFQRAHKIIALLTCEGAAQEEGEMVNAINYRARQIGASGVIAGQTHLNFDSQKFEQVGVVPAGVLLFAFDPALFGFLAF